MDERPRPGTEDQPGFGGTTDYDAEQKRAAEVLEALARTARVESAFGEPYSVAGSTVIPVAEVVNGLGFGMGSGEGPDGAGRGGGAGGGGGARSRPVAVVVVDEQGVRVKPVVDISRLALAGMATFAFSGIWLLRLWRSGESALATPIKKIPTAQAVRGLLGGT